MEGPFKKGVRMAVAEYPELCDVAMEQRPALHPRFHELAEGMSELTFANIYLFRQVHQYRVARLEGDLVLIAGQDSEPFFILPVWLPPRAGRD